MVMALQRWGKIAVLVVLAILLLLASRWLIVRNSDIAFILAQDESLVKCQWGKNDDVIWEGQQFGWKSLLPSNGPIYVRIESDFPEIERFGACLGRFQSLRSISVGGGNKKQIESFFAAIGSQRNVQRLAMYDVPVTDAWCNSIAKWIELREMTVFSANFTGKQWPTLPRLKAVHFSNIPISDTGLGILLKLPALEQLELEQPNLSTLALKELAQNHRGIKQILLLKTGLPKAAVDAAITATHDRNPDCIIEIN